MADKPTAAAPASATEAPKKRDPRLEAVLQHHFWIVSGVVVIAAVVVWYLGTAALNQRFTDDVRTNNSAFSLLSSLKSDQAVNSPPNAKYRTETEKQRDDLLTKVYTAWEKLYERQKVVLPVHERIPKLGELFLLDIAERAAIEQADPEITRERNTYHNNQILEEEFRNLFTMLNLRRPRTAAPAAGAPGAAPAVAAAPVPAAGDDDARADAPGGFEGNVLWNAPYSTNNLMQRYKSQLAPTVDRIAVTYEDVWLFRSMFGVIQRINARPIDEWLDIMDGAEPPQNPAPVDQANVPIKRIDFCDVAQHAMYETAGNPGDVKNYGPKEQEFLPGSEGGGQFTFGSQGTPEEDQVLLAGRYLDGRDVPVADPSQPPVAEFRQVFVQMRVLMDQRLVPALIAECANAPLPIETRQVRLSLEEVDVLRSVDAAAAANQMNKVERSPHDAVVTIRGVIYIYLKPDRKKLGKGSDSDPGNRQYGVPSTKA